MTIDAMPYGHMEFLTEYALVINVCAYVTQLLHEIHLFN